MIDIIWLHGILISLLSQLAKRGPKQLVEIIRLLPHASSIHQHLISFSSSSHPSHTQSTTDDQILQRVHFLLQFSDSLLTAHTSGRATEAQGLCQQALSLINGKKEGDGGDQRGWGGGIVDEEKKRQSSIHATSCLANATLQAGYYGSAISLLQGELSQWRMSKSDKSQLLFQLAEAMVLDGSQLEVASSPHCPDLLQHESPVCL